MSDFRLVLSTVRTICHVNIVTWMWAKPTYAVDKVIRLVHFALQGSSGLRQEQVIKTGEENR